MKKISTLYKKDPNDLGRVINEINPENQWVFDGDFVATRKFDGTAAAIIDGEIYKRYDAKKGRKPPVGAVPCQESDPITGHHPHWVKCERSKPEDVYFFDAFDKMTIKYDGTYELCGPSINGNPEKIAENILAKHGSQFWELSVEDLEFEAIKDFLEAWDVEGVVFHHKTDGRMCKLRKSDFGIKREASVI